jgi:hypothetical protein
VQALAPAVQTLYAELVERRTALDAARTIGDAPGTFVTKSVKGQLYYYFQHTAPGGGLRQVYLGRKTPALEAAGGPSEREAAVRLLESEKKRIRQGPRASGQAASFRISGRLLPLHAYSKWVPCRTLRTSLGLNATRQ